MRETHERNASADFRGGQAAMRAVHPAISRLTPGSDRLGQIIMLLHQKI